MTGSLEREREVSKKNVSLALLEAVNVTAHCKEMCPGPGVINQSGSLRRGHFINIPRCSWWLQAKGTAPGERLRSSFLGREQKHRPSTQEGQENWTSPAEPFSVQSCAMTERRQFAFSSVPATWAMTPCKYIDALCLT